MTDTNKLIKDVAYDIIGITTMWALLNNPYLVHNNTILKLYYNNYYINYSSSYLTIFGIGASICLLRKYM